MNIRTMALSDLEMVLGWARNEGWNPGLSDAPAFFAADPSGFFLADVDGMPAASISVVNHDDDHALLGLYICKPEFRGQGIVLALWKAALEHAGKRSVTLEGVVEQQSNYARSGFTHRAKQCDMRAKLPPIRQGSIPCRPRICLCFSRPIKRPQATTDLAMPKLGSQTPTRVKQ